MRDFGFMWHFTTRVLLPRSHDREILSTEKFTTNRKQSDEHHTRMISSELLWDHFDRREAATLHVQKHEITESQTHPAPRRGL